MKKMIEVIVAATVAVIGVVAVKDTAQARRNYKEGKEKAGKRYKELGRRKKRWKK